MALIRIGGLMRCCIETARTVGSGREGETVECEHCEGRMVWHDGAWGWSRDGRPDREASG